MVEFTSSHCLQAQVEKRNRRSETMKQKRKENNARTVMERGGEKEGKRTRIYTGMFYFLMSIDSPKRI